MTEQTESGAAAADEELDGLDEFDEFAKAHPELCVEITQEWKEQLIKKLEEEMAKGRLKS